MKFTSRLLIVAWVAFFLYPILIWMMSALVGRVPNWAVSFWSVPGVADIVKLTYILLFFLSVGVLIRALYRRGRAIARDKNPAGEA